MHVSSIPSQAIDQRFSTSGRAPRTQTPCGAMTNRSVRPWDTGGRHKSALLDQADSQFDVSIRVLETGQDRSAIAELRKLANFGAEIDLGLGLAPLESARDELGIVCAIYRNHQVIATIRMVPVGHGLTAAERMRHLISDEQILGNHSWEIGRIIVAPEDRDPALLSRCLSLSLGKLLQTKHALHLHATATVPMSRLWRRFGMTTALTTQGASGKRYTLVHGHVPEVARVLQVPCDLGAGAYTPLCETATRS